MNAEQKQRAVESLAAWRATAYALHADRMADLLQDLVDAPEPEPVARVTGYYAWYLSIATVDGMVLPAGTALYAAQPAPSVPVEPMENIALNEWLDKTEWMQKEINTFPVSSLGMHRADVMRLEIERLRKLLSAAPTPAELLKTTNSVQISSSQVEAPSVPDEQLQAAFDRGFKAGNGQGIAQQIEIHKLHDLLAAPTQAEAPADVVRDAARLDWLDERNAPHGLGWEIIQMPAGNVHIHTLTGDKAKFGSIRDAIDAAIDREILGGGHE